MGKKVLQSSNVFYIASQQKYLEPDKIESGVYTFGTQNMSDPSDYLCKQSKYMDIGKNTIANNSYYEQIKKQVDSLVLNQKWFEELDVSCRRGFLLYGPPGTGKTTIQKEIINNLIKDFDAVVIQTSIAESNWESASSWAQLYRRVMKNDSNRLFVFSFTDLNAVELRGTVLTMFRDFLETFTRAPTVYFATTNEFDRIDKSIVNRPGRFDCRLEISALPLQAFTSVCEHYKIGHLANIIYEKNKTATPAILKEIATKIYCFGSQPEEAVNLTLEEFSSEHYEETVPAAPIKKKKFSVSTLSDDI